MTEKPQPETVQISKEEHQKLLEQAGEIEALRDKLLRSAADFDNARKRLAKEREEFVRFSQERLLRELIPILDNFERALVHLETTDKTVAAGIRLIWKQLADLLALHGLKRFSSEGRAFDPHFHEAAGEMEGEGPEGIVLKEIAAGYQLHDRVLRPARVLVRVKKGAKAGEKEKEEELT